MIKSKFPHCGKCCAIPVVCKYQCSDVKKQLNYVPHHLIFKITKWAKGRQRSWTKRILSDLQRIEPAIITTTAIVLIRCGVAVAVEARVGGVREVLLE